MRIGAAPRRGHGVAPIAVTRIPVISLGCGGHRDIATVWVSVPTLRSMMVAGDRLLQVRATKARRRKAAPL